MYKQLIFENEVLTAYTHHLMAPEHVHVNCEFVLVTNGTAVNTVDGVSETIVNGDVFFLNHLPLHSITDLSKDHEHIDLYITREQLRQICLNLFNEELYDFLMKDASEKKCNLSYDEFAVIVKKARKLEVNYILAKNDDMRETYKKCVLSVIIEILGVFFENLYSRQINCPAWLEAFLQETQRPEIFSMSVNDIINLSFYSHTFFCQTFKKCFQRSFKSYIDELRFNHAKNLLATTQLSILDISLTVGYNSSSHFIHKFKQISGITPLQFRNIMQHRQS